MEPFTMMALGGGAASIGGGVAKMFGGTRQGEGRAQSGSDVYRLPEPGAREVPRGD
jgi:hypothetical protein